MDFTQKDVLQYIEQKRKECLDKQH